MLTEAIVESVKKWVAYRMDLVICINWVSTIEGCARGRELTMMIVVILKIMISSKMTLLDDDSCIIRESESKV